MGKKRNPSFTCCHIRRSAHPPFTIVLVADDLHYDPASNLRRLSRVLT